MNKIILNNSIFEDIKHIDKEGYEWWSARELMPILEYSKWENFHKVIKQAMNACYNSKINISDHFPDIRKMVKTGDSIRNIKDYLIEI